MILLGTHFTGEPQDTHVPVIIDIYHRLDVIVGEDLHERKKSEIGFISWKRVEKLLKGPFIGWFLPAGRICGQLRGTVCEYSQSCG